MIQSLGKTPGTFADPVNFRWTNHNDPPCTASDDQLNRLTTSRTRTA
ncbi:hypothetical protein EV648_103534 [Kribbella sp. VKM Ac-2568]|nr:hypothetical protein EV648_103534 [Kribbella sp. VKM Ac-2568]